MSARGLDIPQCSHVILFDLPKTAEAYTHAAGRCGRMGRPGCVTTICTEKARSLALALALTGEGAIPSPGPHPNTNPNPNPNPNRNPDPGQELFVLQRIANSLNLDFEDARRGIATSTRRSTRRPPRDRASSSKPSKPSESSEPS
jgi:superfamily II DNA/RNA helicase